MPAPRFLLVLANPWCAVGEDGEPTGACPCDPNEHTPDRRWVGARIDPSRTVVKKAPTMRLGKLEVPRGEQTQRTVWVFDTEPLRIPDTGYYRDRLRGEPELIAADRETHELVFGSAKPFDAKAVEEHRRKLRELAGEAEPTKPKTKDAS